MLRVSGQIKAATQQIAERTGRPLTYLSSSQVRKEPVARQIAQKDGVSSGLIAILSCVEPCRTYTVGGNPQTKMLEAPLGLGKCLHYYFYHFHPVFGFMQVRLQSWFPFLIHICLNGRNWLAQQMTRLGSYRALNPWSNKDARLWEIVNRGEYAINGFRNRDLRTLLYSARTSQPEQKRRAGAVTRKLRLLRAHGLIRKVSGTHRYVMTEIVLAFYPFDCEHEDEDDIWLRLCRAVFIGG